MLTTSCASRSIEDDLGEEVDRVCTMMCEQNVACHEPPLFEAVDECRELCLGAEKLYQDTPCGAALRAEYECIGSTNSCDEYLDTQNIYAEDYTCKSEKDALPDACLH